MDSDEDDILLRLQFGNNLRLPVFDSGHQMVLELKLVSQLADDVLEEPEEDWILTLTETFRASFMP